MYDFEWHRRHATKTERSAEHTLSILKDAFGFASILDVGCGDGTWLNTGRKLGYTQIRGVDGHWTKLDNLRIDKNDIVVRDLEREFDLNQRFDVAASLEVAEHLSEDASDALVDSLVRHSDAVLFGAAIPYQGGFRHINERWQSFWVGKFNKRGFSVFDILRPQLWHRRDVHFWYKQNMFLYLNRQRFDLIDKAEAHIRDKALSTFPIDLVHPEKYEAIASYDQIAFKPLARKLLPRLGARVKDVVLGKA